MLLGFALGGSTGSAWAEDALPSAQTPDLMIAGLKMAGTLAILIGGLLLLLYLLRRFGASRGGLFGGQDLIRVITSRPLGPRKYITLVEVGGSVLTLGITNDRISCLDKVPLETFRAGAGIQTPPETDGGFAGRLKALATRTSGPSEESKG